MLSRESNPRGQIRYSIEVPYHMEHPYSSPKKSLCFYFFILFLFSPFALSHAAVDILFPLQVAAQFKNDFGGPRGTSGRTHKGIDIIAPKMTPVISAADGYVRYLPMREPSWGYEISIQGDDGHVYKYLHINNDTPGTDDGAGGPEYAYAQGILDGARVTRGQHIGWVGDSGNAEEVGAHLHFEMYDSSGVINPYESLLAAYVTLLASSSATLESTSTAPRFIFTKRLALGSEGEEVRELQKRLRALGHFAHPTDTGYFGKVTASALIAYQKTNGVDPIGILGPRTRAVLNK
jgi:murein DD-endopeptidase MepM/ murein hydrolase activator NlpD